MTVIVSEAPAARLAITDRKHTTTVSIPASPSIVISARGPQGPSGGLSDGPILQLDTVIDEDVTLETDKNALSVGPLAINAGWSVTVPSGAVWMVL